jgi:succinate dehydrogenase / fumarate reductase, membrane anchor subunit
MKPMAPKKMRSPLGRAIWLGSAKEGVEHWWQERVTAAALVPLMLWFIGSIIAHSGSDYTVFVTWLKTPVTTLMMVSLLIALFYHTTLGLQLIVEDYVHSTAKIPLLILVRLACFLIATAGILAVLRISCAINPGAVPAGG